MKQIISFLVFIFSVCISGGQPLSAYSDYKNVFFVFDNGIKQQLEYLPVKSYYVGGNAVAYVNEGGDVKVYYKGISYDLYFTFPTQIIATNNLIVCYGSSILKVFDNGVIKTLSVNTTDYTVGDSIVSFYDNNNSSMNIYYKGKIIQLEDYIGGSGRAAMAGGNIAVWATPGGNLSVFYQDRISELENSILTGQLGNNVFAYTDVSTQEFKAFYRGTSYTLENLAPKTSHTATDMISYIDNMGNFKVFYDGKTTKLSSFEPIFYTTHDHLLVYGEQTSFNIFYKGKIYKLENYIPAEYRGNSNLLAYKDKEGYLHVFYDGQVQKITREKVDAVELSGNTLKFYTGLNEVHFFSEGKLY